MQFAVEMVPEECVGRHDQAYLMCVGAHRGCEASGQAKVSNLDGVCVALHQDVLGLQVTVQHSIGMNEGHSLQHLVHV